MTHFMSSLLTTNLYLTRMNYLPSVFLHLYCQNYIWYLHLPEIFHDNFLYLWKTSIGHCKTYPNNIKDKKLHNKSLRILSIITHITSQRYHLQPHPIPSNHPQSPNTCLTGWSKWLTPKPNFWTTFLSARHNIRRKLMRLMPPLWIPLLGALFYRYLTHELFIGVWHREGSWN